MKARHSLFTLLLAVGAAQAEPVDSGLIGLARNQSLRLSVVAEADDLTGPCKVFLGFLDSTGELIKDSAGRQISKHIDLEPGQTAHLDIQGNDVLPGMAENGRTALLPTVQVQPDGDGKNQCPGVMANVEVLDQKVGSNVVSLGNPAAY
jgi:hypothetical protein